MLNNYLCTPSVQGVRDRGPVLLYVSGCFLIRNLFFADSLSLHTYPASLAWESATFSIRSSGWIRIRNSVDGEIRRIFFLKHDNVTKSNPVFIYLVRAVKLGLRLKNKHSASSPVQPCSFSFCAVSVHTVTYKYFYCVRY